MSPLLRTIALVGLVTLLSGCDSTPSISLPGSFSGAVGDPTWITIQILSVQVLQPPNDIDQRTEFRFFMVAGDEDPRYSAAFVYPARDNLAVTVGDVIDISSHGLAVEESRLTDGKLYVYFMGLDADEQGDLTNLGIDAITSRAADGLAQAIARGNPTVALITSLVLGGISDSIQADDVIGDGLFILSPQEGWGVGKNHVIESENGGLRITYRVTRNETRGSEIAFFPRSTSENGVASRGDGTCSASPPPRLSNGAEAVVAWQHVNLRTNPEVPSDSAANVIATLSEGSVVTITDGPYCAYEGYWWQVQTREGQSGWMREAGSERTYLLPGSARATSSQPATTSGCAGQIHPELAALWNQDKLGCPTAAPQVVWSAWQPFERGAMLWRSDASRVSVFYEDGTWKEYPDQWVEGAEIVSRGDPPAGLVAPIRGFGYVWGNHSEVVDRLGWARVGEQGFCATVQSFEQGFLLRSLPGSLCSGSNGINWSLEASFDAPFVAVHTSSNQWWQR